MIKFISITNNPVFARNAEASGVDRIFVDLEILGKKERQGHLDTLISSHEFADIERVKNVLDRADLIARLNPLHAGSAAEVEMAIGHGAKFLMLPMFHEVSQVRTFAGLVDGRAGVIPLVETAAAIEALEDIVRLPDVTEIYIGLNDLHLDMGLNFMFEPLANGLIDEAAAVIKQAGLPFGFGGVARIGEGIVPGELVLAEHARLESSSVILSRTFNRELETESGHSLGIEVDRLKSAYRELLQRSPAEVETDRVRLQLAVRQFVESRLNETPV